MVGLLDIAVQAHNPSNPLYPLVAYEKSSSSLRIRNVPRQIGSWRITSVTVAAQYPDQTTRTAQCVLVGGIWVGTLQGSEDPGEGTYSVYAAGMDENNMPVNDYHLGSGQVTILEAETRRDENATVHMLYGEPTAETREGDLFQSGQTSAWMIFKDGQAVPLAKGGSIDPEDYYTKSETSSAAEISAGFAGTQPSGDYATHAYVDNLVNETETELSAKRDWDDLQYWSWKPGDSVGINGFQLLNGERTVDMFTFEHGGPGQDSVWRDPDDGEYQVRTADFVTFRLTDSTGQQTLFQFQPSGKEPQEEWDVAPYIPDPAPGGDTLLRIDIAQTNLATIEDITVMVGIALNQINY